MDNERQNAGSSNRSACVCSTIACAIGVCTAWLGVRLGDPWGGAGWVWRGGAYAYQQVGIVVVGLVPLAVWALRLVLAQLRGARAGRRVELDYDYIARSSTLLGLLGTVISLSMATVQLAHEVTIGSSAAILKVIPLTGQALVSTMVGLMIAFVAETALHAIERSKIVHE
ncbi:MAG: MotA/TolQ/ExbB proton channel family protein [Lentisphaerae bacterium]|nr:MotA/TolQ/ExbB proton channel family protein [Lentisphaerota bacterium]